MKRVLSLLLALILWVSVLPGGSVQAAEALSLDAVKALLNAEELYPQRTGYAEIDNMLEELLAPCEGKDTYTKIKTLYDWTVNEVDYSWDGYSQEWAPAYDKFTLKYDLTYETGLPKAYPEDMIYRAYHMLTAKTGVCYDWGILFAVMARYVGIESYVHTGILRIGEWTGHHGWTELKLGGKNYIFDAQQDNRELTSLGVADPHLHFGIPAATADRWTQAADENDPRDSSLLPVTADRVRVSQVTVEASRSGEVTGGGICAWGQTATLTAPDDLPVEGWYNAKGELLAEGQEYSFIPEGDTTVYALFRGDHFVDLADDDWYVEDVCEAAEQDIVDGVTAIFFAPGSTMTRAMLATILARADGAELSEFEDCPFEDVKHGSWYAPAVNWAYANGVVEGVSETSFAPMATVTREQAATMIVRWMQGQDVPTAAENLAGSFSDVEAVSSYARYSLSIAKGTGVLSGYEDGTIRPKAPVTRAEGVTFLMRGLRYVEADGIL